MRKLYIQKCGLISIFAFVLTGCASPGSVSTPSNFYYVKTSQRSFAPELGPQQKLGMIKFLPNSVMLETPILPLPTVKIKGSNSFTIASEKFDFSAGEIMDIRKVAGPSTKNISADAVIFCGRIDVDTRTVTKTALAGSAFGIPSLFMRTSAFSQPCFIDADNDGVAEQAFLMGAKNEKDALPVDISHLPYVVITKEPDGKESVARIVYLGKVGFNQKLGFELRITENGKKVLFDDARTVISAKNIPKDVNIMGTEFTIEAYNPENEEIQVNISQGFQKREYKLKYPDAIIPVYVPK